MAYSGSSLASAQEFHSAGPHTSGAAPGLRRPASGLTPGSPAPTPRSSDSDHQLEKLEFALAVAMTRGDGIRIQALREQIAALGGNWEEPGT
jgi:hypothetical protein